MNIGNLKFRYGGAIHRIAAFTASLMLVLGTQAVPMQVAQAATNTLTLSVVSTVGATPVTDYKYIINVDNTGTTEQRTPGDGCSTDDAGYPGSCNWVSIAGAKSSSPIFTQGDQNDFGGGISLPNGRYLISVLADGYKMDGEHFSVPLAGSGNVTVQMQPFPLPDATVRAYIFEDTAPTNSAPDVPAENPLAGFVGHLADYIDEVTTDVYANPLCTRYEGEDPNTFVIPPGSLDVDGLPVPIPGSGGQCVSDANGMLAIPHLGPNRYALSAVPPNGSDWIQTTTLEGNHDWDAWVMEGATGLDTEFVVAGEPFPAIFFGYVHSNVNTMSGGSGHVTGLALAVNAYWPPVGGITGEPGLLGGKPNHPIAYPWLSLSDLNGGDTAVYVGKGNADGTFDIANVPAGDYVLAVWDDPQNYILNFMNVSVGNGETVDLGSISMMGWWTTLDGYVFSDDNENGIMDNGEAGVPNFPLVMRKRENSVMDRGATAFTTDAFGYYYMENAYPMTQWLVEEAYADGFRTTGITYQADNQPDATTILGGGVDVNVLPIIGLGGRMDWGVKAYAPNTNGGIVGTVSYDTTRNELDPRFAAVEDWQPGISDITVNLYEPLICDGTTPCDPTDLYQLNADGSYATGKLLNQYLTETWEQPAGCVARNFNGDPLVLGVDENVLPTNPNAPCLEGPLMGVQYGPLAGDVGTPDENFGASVNGNYGFGDGCFGAGGFDPNTGACADSSAPTSLPSNRNYLVKLVIPTEGDVYDVNAVHPTEPLYKVTREEDINIGNGDQWIPQVPPPACAGALHTVDVADGGLTTDTYPEIIGTGYDTDLGENGVALGVTVPESEPTVNQTFLDIGATPQYEGQPKPLCDMKLVLLSDRKSIAPTFNLFTDVPLPGRLWGLLVDDLNFSSDPKSLLVGEKMGIPFAPVGIYDYTNRLITTVESDYNGLYDVLLPSTNRINCPTPSGVCANLYRLVGNDPGIPGRWNANYTPQYRTIAAEFETFPGLIVPADLAPTQVGVGVQIPGSQTLVPVSCTLDTVQPQLFAVNTPYVDLSNGLDHTFTIDGLGFGSAGQVLLDGVVSLPTVWGSTQLTVTVPANTVRGVHQLSIRSSNGMSTVNGLTFHVLAAPVTIITAPPFPSSVTIGLPDTFTTVPILLPNLPNDLGPLWNRDALATGVFAKNSGVGHIRTGAGLAFDSWFGLTGLTLFGANQEARVTLTQISTDPGANEQGLLLKYSGGANPNDAAAQWIEVAYDNDTDGVPGAPLVPGVRIRTKSGGTITTQSTLTGAAATFANGNILGARALSNGSIIVYKNGTAIGVPITAAATAAWTGRIGVRFEGTGTTAATEARIDDFGGGNVTVTTTTIPGYLPSLFEVGPGYLYPTIQSALDMAATGPAAQNSLVVVYPGASDLGNPRYNGRGAYYENIVIHSRVKLQGVGPGGVYANNTPVQGSIIDGIAFGGDTALADAWRTLVGGLTWSGNQNVSDGAAIYVLAQDGQFTSANNAAIDGFDIRGGDQMGFPGNLNAIFGGFPGPLGIDGNAETQGGAIFVNGYARYLGITNNVVENNGGAYGTIRIGTPNLPAPDTNNENDNLRIANNRILANGGTNLAGALGLFNGADNYVVANNDFCGNFSAEYGGAISHFGLSPNGSIHDNRIYFNRSYDEGAGIMIAGELPVNPTANYGTANGPQGSGAVNIYNNLIQGNLSDDDGGGLRFLMAGNFPMNVYNNMIVNNVSTHEGGGVALDDAPNVRFYNNTVMKNITTATAVTSNGAPAPAGLSTGGNSAQLQATLPGGIAGCGVGTNAKCFSDPLLFNNIFWDNRAGSRGINNVLGIGAPGDLTAINNWDMGLFSGPGSLAPTNSMLQVTTGTTPSGTNTVGVDPLVISPYDVGVTFASWRTNVNFIGAILVTADLPPNLLGNYHIPSGSAAVNTGASSKAVPAYQSPPGTLAAPTIDIDNQTRPICTLPTLCIDKGADEIGSGPAVTAFPLTAVLDNFNRSTGSGTQGLGGNWSGDANTPTLFRITPTGGPSDQVQVRGSGGQAYWNTSFGANQEAFFTFTDLGAAGTQEGLFLKFNGASPTSSNAAYIRVTYNPAGTGSVIVRTRTSAQGLIPRLTISGVSFAVNDILGVRALYDGTVLVFKNGVQIGSVNVTSGATPWPIARAHAGGRIGAWFNGGSYASNEARFDNFGGGTMP